MRNKFEGSSLLVLSSPRSVCAQRGGRSEHCSHTSQVQFFWFIPSSALGFLALLNKHISGRNLTIQGDVWFVLPTPWHLELAVVSQVSPSPQPAQKAASQPLLLQPDRFGMVLW